MAGTAAHLGDHAGKNLEVRIERRNRVLGHG
jgi:hypothetical protein